MKNIQCYICGAGISPFIQTWKEFMIATEGWKKYYCIGEPKGGKQHDFNICPKHTMHEQCPICDNVVISEAGLNELNASIEDTGSVPRFY